MSKSLTKQTFNGALWLGGVKASNAILQFIILAILARLLSPSEFGLMGLALTVVAFSDIFNDMGFGPAITQKEKLSKTDIHTGFTYSIVFGLILVVLIWVTSPLIASFFKNEELIPILKAISIVLLLRAVTTAPLGLMYREMQFKKLSLIQITSYALGYGAVGITLAYLEYGVWSLVIAVICQAVLSLFLYLFFSKGVLGLSFNKKSFKELIHFGGGYSLSKIFSYAANSGDKILVGRILGVDALGLYERSYQLVKYAASLFGEIIDKVLFSPIARKQNDREVIKDVYLELTYVLAILFLPLSVFIYNNAHLLVRIILGDQWDDSIPIVKIMSISVFFLISTRIGSTIAKSLGDVYRRAYRTLFVAILIILSVWFGSKWGIEGVAVAVVLCQIINYILAYTQVSMLTPIKANQFIEAHLLGLIVMVVYQGLVFLVEYYMIFNESNLIISLFANTLILTVVYILGMVLDYKRVLKKYFKIIFNK